MNVFRFAQCLRKRVVLMHTIYLVPVNQFNPWHIMCGAGEEGQPRSGNWSVYDRMETTPSTHTLKKEALHLIDDSNYSALIWIGSV